MRVCSMAGLDIERKLRNWLACLIGDDSQRGTGVHRQRIGGSGCGWPCVDVYRHCVLGGVVGVRWCVVVEVFGLVWSVWTGEVGRANVLVRELGVDITCLGAVRVEYSVECGRAVGVRWVYISGRAASGWTGSWSCEWLSLGVG